MLESAELQFYLSRGIDPSKQVISDWNAHLGRRQSLLDQLGVTELSVRDRHVLEVGAGSGQNSAHIASMRPARLVLVEPNPVAIEQIKRTFSQLPDTYTCPEIVGTVLNEAKIESQFDIVIAENVDGGLEHEKNLLAALARRVRPNGLLCVTHHPPTGILATLCRRIMSEQLVLTAKNDDDVVHLLVSAFEPHLNSLSHMTRPAAAWVYDNLLNSLVSLASLPIQDMFSELGDEFEIFNSYPRFWSEWRWYKSIDTENRNFSESFFASYFRNAHNFIDASRSLPEVTIDDGRFLIELSKKLIEHMGAQEAGQVLATLRSLAGKLECIEPLIGQNFRELLTLAEKPCYSLSDIQNMKGFQKLFGREVLYLCFKRRGRL